ncbi:sodium/dicarboxylate symporter [Aequoribacter fuscus]|uniref:Serine/threonine transporter SstT n=1 Tax=Aequoribacter fuscus TaxID=2518989 RepID=F3L479_9GAMM|nr:serine/threonine transporter SstT [Aequoribacter fuscus]EGG28851.1 sodium/dicarboxylate symporter [Aequoribacter fuscus]
MLAVIIALGDVMALFDSKGLVFRIAVGVIVGAVLGLLAPDLGQQVGILGELFVGLLKAIAPMLVLVLVTSALANLQRSQTSRPAISLTLLLYLLGTVGAAVVALLLSVAFPQQLHLLSAVDGNPPGSVLAVLADVLRRMVDNPIRALIEANFLACLVWGVLFGLSFRSAPGSLRHGLAAVSERLTEIVRWIIQLAPLGIFGLVSVTVARVGVDALMDYLNLALLLVAAMLVVAFGVNALIVGLLTRKNPYPLILACLRDSGITAFFTRSSAANIPVNLALSERLGLPSSLYSVTIPVGATINMAGAAITITVLTLAAVNTLGIEVGLVSSLLLCIVAALAACGASGVPSGSLLLIPLACGLFGISADVAMQVVAVGFVISVVQDSAETALNSSTDVVFTATVSERLGLTREVD